MKELYNLAEKSYKTVSFRADGSARQNELCGIAYFSFDSSASKCYSGVTELRKGITREKTSSRKGLTCYI